MVKKTKGGKVMNPTDAYRKELRKKELKRNKKERKKVREVGILRKDPEQIREQIQKLEMMKAEGALDKARKHKKRQLEDTLNVVLKKRKEHEEKMKEKGEAPVMFSHLGPPPRRRTEDDEGASHPKPEDSVYYHPTLNPTGAPPPGKPPMYKSSIGPRIPLSEASSSSSIAPDSTSDLDNATIPLPPPPPPPPLPKTNGTESSDDLITPESLPLPPPPMPPSSGMAPSLPPPPPPPPGPAPKEQFALHPPPPPPLQQPPPPGTIGAEREPNKSLAADGLSLKETNLAPSALTPPLPRPPGLPHPLSGNQLDSKLSNSNSKTVSGNNDISRMAPPPPRQPAPLTGTGMIPSIQSDIYPPGISRALPPPPVPDLHPQLAHVAGLLGGAVAPPGVIPILPRPPFGPPSGPPPMMRPPLPPGPPPSFQPEDHFGARPTVLQKPSYVKSAAPTVVKRPLAQHTPELTAMVPASVRVRRESVLPKQKLKSTSSNPALTSQPSVSVTTMNPLPHSTSSTVPPKGQSIDDSYSAFLEDMKALGALDS